MPKPVKKAVRKLKAPPKPKRPTDPVRAASAMFTEHMSRVQEEPGAGPPPALDFEAQYKAHMSKLGKKGGDVSGERRMQMPVEVRRRVASIAARAMWAKRKADKKR